MTKYIKAIKMAVLFSLITGIVNIFIFFGDITFLPVPLIAGALIAITQKEIKIYKYLDKLLVGSIVFGFFSAFMTQAIMYLASNLIYNSGMPFMVFYNPQEYFMFSLVFLFLSFLGGLLGIVLKGFYFIYIKSRARN